MDGERTYSMSEIREKRRATEQLLALQQRRLDALAKIDEGTAEFEQVEREIEALARGEAQPEQPAETLHSEPHAIGERSLTILMDHADTWLIPREVLADMERRGWVDADPDHVIQRLRHSLRRLAHSNDRVERDESGATYRYRWRSHIDGYAPAAVSHANGAARPALYGGRSDDLDE